VSKKEFSAELQRLAAPSQQVILSVRKMAPEAEKTVMMAFHESIKVLLLLSSLFFFVEKEELFEEFCDSERGCRIWKVSSHSSCVRRFGGA
jgi:hypothetical protein